MREIKFRGKRADNKNWVYGYFFIDLENKLPYIMLDKRNETIEDWMIKSVVVIPETVGEFTSLKDINGIDIYEGDIVEGISNNEFSKGMYSEYEIMWGIDSWHVKGTYFSLQELFNYCNNKIKVIGNIYEKLNQNG